MTNSISCPAPSQAAAAAALWYDRLHGQPTPADLAAFAAWRAVKQENASAYAEIEQVAKQVRSLKDTPEMLALRSETLNRVAEQGSRRIGRWAMAAGLVACLGVGGLWGLSRTFHPFETPPVAQIAAADMQTYRTRIGEQLSATLADGSVVHLNTQSAVQVRYTGSERRLTLLQGQVLFEVAKAPHRPFVVTAQGRTVTAVGTQFDVRVDSSQLQIALIEGTVVVRDGASSNAAETILKPNDVLHFAGNRVSLTHLSSLRGLTSWKNGLVVFENTPLAEAVSELNRYTPHSIVVGDAQAASLKISGSFPTAQPASFLEAVQLIFPVKVARAKDGRAILRYAG